MILAFMGKNGSGKSSAREACLSLFSGSFYEGFGTPVRENCRIAMNIDSLEELEATKEVVHPIYGFTPRYYMEQYATEFVRDKLHKDMWILNWTIRVKQHLRLGLEEDLVPKIRPSCVVVDDLRFVNEYEYLRSIDDEVLIFEVIRKGQEDLSAGGEVHESKRSLREQGYLPDFTLHNDFGTVREWKCCVRDRLLEELL